MNKDVLPPLSVALENRNFELPEYLIDQKACLYSKNGGNASRYLSGPYNFSDEINKQKFSKFTTRLFQKVLENCDNVAERTAHIHYNNFTTLRKAIRSDTNLILVKLFIRERVDLAKVNHNDKNSLNYALNQFIPKIVSYLLKANPDLIKSVS